MDMFSFFPSWLLPAILPILLFSYIFINALPWKKSSTNNPPSPPRLPIIGNLHQVLGKSLHQTILKLSQKYGPIMLLHLGSQPYIIISSSELANQVLKTHDHILSSRPRSKGFKRLTFNYMDLTFSPSGDHWRKMRKILVTEFFSKRSKLFKNTTENEVKGMLGTLSSLPVNTTITLDDTLTDLVTDISSKFIVGKSYRKEVFRGRTLKEILNELVILLAGSFTDIFPTFGGILNVLSGWNRKLEKLFSDLDGFLEMILDEHIESEAPEQEKDLIDACSSLLTRDEMKGLLTNSINGSIDTTTMTTVWAMSEIVKNPRVLQKLQDEIRSGVGRKSSVDESDITQMPYLKLVVKETLRLHSPAPWLLVRECVEHCQVGGYDIFPGTRILINSWGIGRDPKIWSENADEFYPERLENFKVDHCEMIPFGGGRRSCPAANLATTVVEITIANLLNSFDWKLPTGMKYEDLDMEEEGTLVVKRKTPLRVVPVKHNWQD